MLPARRDTPIGCCQAEGGSITPSGHRSAARTLAARWAKDTPPTETNEATNATVIDTFAATETATPSGNLAVPFNSNDMAVVVGLAVAVDVD